MDASVAETHMSVVIFLGDHAYKLKKPVKFPFVDLTTREAREAICHREVTLNRRLAPDVYEGVAEVRSPDGSICDHLVVMRRLPDDRRLSRLVADRDPRVPGAIDEIARMLARFHRHADRSSAIDGDGRRDSVAARWHEIARQIRALAGNPFDPDQIDRADALAERFLAGREALLADRIESGKICDGHGDLLADDVFILDDGPRILDCIEFDDHLRHVDVIDDLAVLAMDLERLGGPALAAQLIDTYQRESGEVVPVNLLHFYIAYRAQVRALVAALRSGQTDDAEVRARRQSRATELLRLCIEHLERGTVRLVLVGGLPGTGKTTIATDLGRRMGWAVLHSDVVRKRVAGHHPGTSLAAPYRRGIYTPEMTEATYDTLLERAGELLELGLSVVVDASFVADDDRACARLLAKQKFADLVELHCTVDADTAARRIASRQIVGGDASDADQVIAARLAEIADPWPESTEIDNGGSIDDAMAHAIARLSTVQSTPTALEPGG